MGRDRRRDLALTSGGRQSRPRVRRRHRRLPDPAPQSTPPAPPNRSWRPPATIEPVYYERYSDRLQQQVAAGSRPRAGLHPRLLRQISGRTPGLVGGVGHQHLRRSAGLPVWPNHAKLFFSNKGVAAKLRPPTSAVSAGRHVWGGPMPVRRPPAAGDRAVAAGDQIPGRPPASMTCSPRTRGVLLPRGVHPTQRGRIPPSSCGPPNRCSPAPGLLRRGWIVADSAVLRWPRSTGSQWRYRRSPLERRREDHLGEGDDPARSRRCRASSAR